MLSTLLMFVFESKLLILGCIRSCLGDFLEAFLLLGVFLPCYEGIFLLTWTSCLSFARLLETDPLG